MGVYPAMRGKLGSTEYFTTVIKARDMVQNTKVQSPDDWSNVTMNEIYQRKLDYDRVVKHIAPYLAKDKNRFFGSIILSVTGKLKFIPFNKLLDGQDLNPLYEPFESQLNSMGMLSIGDGAEWSPMDGQHRIAAIQCAIEGKDHDKNEVKHFSACPKIGDEDVTVILIAYDKHKVRKIFTMVNRYAKKVTAGEVYLLDDDNIYAVLSRRISDIVCGGRLVGIRKAQIGDKDKEGYFTTLTNVVKINKNILNIMLNPSVKISDKILPSENKQQMYWNTVEKVWQYLTKNITHFKNALSNKNENGDKQRIEMRKTCLLLKPVPQSCLFTVFCRMTKGQDFTYEKAAIRLNKIKWEKDNPIWNRVLMLGGTILTSKKNEILATDLIYYMAGGKLTKEEEGKLLTRYRSLFEGEEPEKKHLPKKVG